MKLHVGIDRYEDGDNLTVCEADAREWQRLLPGYLCLNEAATLAEIEAGFDMTTREVVPGKWRAITFSGHGSWDYDANKDEADKHDECLVTTDCHGFWDDQIRKYLSRATPDSPILFVTDSCHSRTVYRGGTPPGKLKSKDPATLKPRLATYQSSPNNAATPLPNVLHIAACADRRSAYEGEGHGVLNGALFHYLKPDWTIRAWLMAAFDEVRATGWQIASYNATPELLDRKCSELFA